MKLSTKSRYGLRALIDLALNSQTDPVSISSIAARQGISDSYLEQLIGKLKKAGLVDSVRGVQGGYRLSRPPEEISVGEVLRVLEGDMTPAECTGLSEGSGCEHAHMCTTKYVWKKINDSVQDTVDNIYINELMVLEEE